MQRGAAWKSGICAFNGDRSCTLVLHDDSNRESCVWEGVKDQRHAIFSDYLATSRARPGAQQLDQCHSDGLRSNLGGTPSEDSGRSSAAYDDQHGGENQQAALWVSPGHAQQCAPLEVVLEYRAFDLAGRCSAGRTVPRPSTDPFWSSRM